MKKEYLNKNVVVTCIDGQVIKGEITEWEDEHIDINLSIEIPLKEIARIELESAQN